LTVNNSFIFDIQGDSLLLTDSAFDQTPVNIVNANTTINSSTFENSQFYGLAVTEFDGDLMIFDSVIQNNETIGLSTYGVDTPSDRIHIVRTEINGNGEGAMVVDADEVLIANSLIKNNFSDNPNVSTINFRPSIFDQAIPRFVIFNSIIANNVKAAGQGGGVVRMGSNGQVAILSSTIVNNSTGGSGSVVHVNSSDPDTLVEITNSILWGNTSTDDSVISNSTSTFVASSTIQDEDPNDSNIPFGGTANDNIDDAPLFVNESAEDFHILVGSPTIDAGAATFLRRDDLDVDGDNNVTEFGPDFDLMPRIVGASTDMGAYEFVQII